MDMFVKAIHLERGGNEEDDNVYIYSRNILSLESQRVKLIEKAQIIC